MVNSFKISQEYIEKEKQEQLREIERRKALFRPPSSNNNEYNIKGRTVILVDDGIATGATIIVAARWIRKQQPRQLILAAPAAQPQIIDMLKREADLAEVITTPSNFSTVGQFYHDFNQVTDEQVISIIREREEERRRKINSHP